MQIMLMNVNEVDVKKPISHCSKRTKLRGSGKLELSGDSHRECSFEKLDPVPLTDINLYTFLG